MPALLLLIKIQKPQFDNKSGVPYSIYLPQYCNISYGSRRSYRSHKRAISSGEARFSCNNWKNTQLKINWPIFGSTVKVTIFAGEDFAVRRNPHHVI